MVSTLDPRLHLPGILGRELGDGGAGARRPSAGSWIPPGHFTAHYGIKGNPPAGEALNRVFGFADAEAVARHFAAAGEGRLPGRRSRAT